MISLTLAALLATSPQGDTTSLPRQRDMDTEREHAAQSGIPTDPLFNREFVATDDPAFVLTAIESSRQGVKDASSARPLLESPQLRTAAEAIGKQNQETLARLEALARRKGWRIPQNNPDRSGTLPVASPVRTAANFVVNQISYHQATVAQFRAQLGGNGDADLKRALRQALPGYEENLRMLLVLEL